MSRRMLLPIVSGLVRAILLPPSGDSDTEEDARLANTASTVVAKIQGMPRHISLAMVILTVSFDLWGLLVSLRPFRSQSHSQRLRQIRGWGGLPFGVCQDFLDFHTKMSTFIYYSQRAQH